MAYYSKEAETLLSPHAGATLSWRQSGRLHTERNKKDVKENYTGNMQKGRVTDIRESFLSFVTQQKHKTNKGTTFLYLGVQLKEVDGWMLHGPTMMKNLLSNMMITYKMLILHDIRRSFKPSLRDFLERQPVITFLNFKLTC